MTSYIIEGNLSEKQIELDVAAFMTWCSPEGGEPPFRLLDVNEQVTGADARFDVASAIYIQFKKSQGLKPATKVSKRKNKSKLQEVREFRAERGLADNPSLFFQLRKKAKKARDWQHNVLLAHENPPISRAIYVAPLILDKDRYHEALFSSHNRFLGWPFYQRHLAAVSPQRWTRYLGAVPFLREHISIPPYERVTTHNHYFAFSESGVDVSWHSPEVVSREPMRLSDFLVDYLGSALVSENALYAKADLASAIRDHAPAGAPVQSGADETPFQWLARYGRWLWEVHAIRQFLVLGARRGLDEWRAETR